MSKPAQNPGRESADRLPAADRRELILAATARLICEKGEYRATMREIGQASGVLMSTLYYYYASKDHLICDVHEAGVAEIRQRVETAISRQTGPWERFAAAAEAHLEAILDPNPFCRIVQLPLPQIPQQLREHVVNQRNRYEDLQRSLIADLPLAPEVDRTLLRLGLIGMLNAAPNWYRARSDSSPSEIARTFVGFLRYGTQNIASPPTTAG